MFAQLDWTCFGSALIVTHGYGVGLSWGII